MTTIGITGAAGYIGGAIVKTLRRTVCELRLVDNLSGPVSTPPPELPLCREDFASPTALQYLEDCDVVLHLAAISGVMACAQDPTGSRRVNLDGTARLAEFCHAHQIPVALASSLSVVGRPERLPVTEATPAAPTHEYARQKAEAEAIVLGQRLESVPSLALRMSNLYGTYEVGGKSIGKGNVVNLFARQAISGRLTVNAPGTQRRDFIHIEDVATAWASTARHLADGTVPDRWSRVLVASGENQSVLGVAHLVEAARHVLHPQAPPLRIDVVPNPRGDVELLDERFAVDPRASLELLGIRLRHSLAGDLVELLSNAESAGAAGASRAG
ncbi:MAG: NAD-dependent epimerase/dehydratase family protein [Thermoplasmata archaeon]